MTPIARYLDSAILKPEMTRADVEAAIRDGVARGVRTVCVRPCDLGVAKSLTGGTETGVCVVLGFPHGDQLSDSKVDEARRYVAAGVAEVDMVANYGWVRSGMWDEVRADIAGVAEVCRAGGVALKVIFETAHLDLAQVERLVEICVGVGADFVKTSTGFNGAGATDEAVEAMLRVGAGRIQVKPSGGIRDRARAEHFLAMGVHRLGVGYTSCGAICEGEGSSAGAQGY